jgi:hypothetical protein
MLLAIYNTNEEMIRWLGRMGGRVRQKAQAMIDAMTVRLGYTREVV